MANNDELKTELVKRVVALANANGKTFIWAEEAAMEENEAYANYLRELSGHDYMSFRMAVNHEYERVKKTQEAPVDDR